MSAGRVMGQRYKLIEELGRGGMGSVWRAVDLELDAPAAVKLIEEKLVESPEALTRFKREAKAAASIRSTHVVQILGYGVDGETPYIAMELMKGESLAKSLERSGCLSAEFTLTVLTHVSRALTLAHGRGIVHRDLKPDNIFLVQEADQCIAKVLDFGVARQRGGLADSGGLQTKTGAVLGTPYYMSPEQATAKPVDHLSDIWSFGVIASECLTGRRPFESDTLGGLFSAICIDPMPVPSQLGPVPSDFDAWFAKAVARDKARRFQTVAQAAEALKLVCQRPSMSPAICSDLPQRTDTVVSPGFEAQAATYPVTSSIEQGLQTTAAPSTQSVPGLPRPSLGKPMAIAITAAVFVAGVGYAGWRMISPPAASSGEGLVPAVPTTNLTPPAMSVLPVATQQSPSISSDVVPTVSVEQLPVATSGESTRAQSRNVKPANPALDARSSAPEPRVVPPSEGQTVAPKPAAPTTTDDRLGI